MKRHKNLITLNNSERQSIRLALEFYVDSVKKSEDKAGIQKVLDDLERLTYGEEWAKE